MKYVALFLLCGSLSAVAKEKQHYEYQFATLVDFRTVHGGQRCSGNGSTHGTVDDSGDIKAETSSSSGCSDTFIKLYTIALADHTFVIKHVLEGGPILTGLGVNALFARESVLANALPGAQIRVRTDSSGLYVYDGKRESKFSIVEAK